MSKGMVEALRYNARVYCSKQEMRSWMEKAADCIEKMDSKIEEQSNWCVAIEKEDAMIHCSMCDRLVNPHIDNFCRGCGRPLKGEQVTPEDFCSYGGRKDGEKHD
ncbi:hypothetical protein [Anaerotruncus massiliensis (ex Liu et al. 2021)]|uniref:hypothetical protein n=1 Tax=Anaerotruncus massiliensis (ex Liu et al. 2021) TaxID=2321404 RepID=UPI003AB45111